jgi:hypothetical protein
MADLPACPFPGVPGTRHQPLLMARSHKCSGPLCGFLPLQHLPAFSLIQHDHFTQKEKNMNDEKKVSKPVPEIRCPECRALLKPRHGRNPDPCDLVCGGCGKQFKGCEIEEESR